MVNLISMLVKVGKQSDIKFKSKETRVIRAITGKEFNSILDNTNVDIIIIESIQEHEYNNIKQSITKLKEDNTKNVIFYIKGSDETTGRLAEELGYSVYTELKDIYKLIYDKYNVDLSVGIREKIMPSVEEMQDSNIEENDTIDNKEESKEELEVKSDDINTESSDENNNSSIIDKVATVVDGAVEVVGKVVDVVVDETIDTASKLVKETIETVQDVKDIVSDKASVEELEVKATETIDKQQDFQKDTEIDNLKARVVELEDIVESAIDEAKRYKGLLDNIKADDDIIEDPVAYSEYQKLEDELRAERDKLGKVEEELKLERSNLTKVQSELRVEQDNSVKAEELNQLTEAVNRLEDEKIQLQSTIDSISSEKEVIENNLREIELQKEALESQLEVEIRGKNDLESVIEETKKALELEIENNKEVQEKHDNLVEQLQESNDTIELLREQLEDSSEAVIELQNQLESTNEKLEETTKLSVNSSSIIDEYKDRIKCFSDNLDVNNNLLIRATEKINELQEIRASLESSLLGSNKITEALNEQVVSLKEQVANLTGQCEQYRIDIGELNIEIRDLTTKASAVDTIESQCREKYAEQINKLNIEKVEAQSKLNIVSAQLSAKEHQYELLMQTTGMDSSTAGNIVENNKTLEALNSTLRNQLNILKGDLDKANKERVFALNTIKNLEDTNKQLKTSLAGMTHSISSGGGIQIPPCNYSGKGLIIPVFGCGSFGITTTAMSIAQKLSQTASVLFIDFDIVLPKADGWFNRNPIIKEIPDGNPMNTNQTGLGLFLDRQVGYFLQYSNYIINNIASSTKGGGKLDYISGLYVKQDPIKLISADYTTFFNFCGNGYDYVIVDMGKLGCSDIGDQLIRMVSSIAYRNVVVTTNDKFEVRNFSVKLTQNRIDKSNTFWLLNVCENTKNLEEQVKKCIRPANYSMMPFSMDLYGKRLGFSNNKLTRDRCDSFINNIFK